MSNLMETPAAAQRSPADKALMEKVLWRVMPLATACMIIGTIDRSNVGFAKLSMANDLGMSEAIFAFGSSLFYLGYIAFEIPSALAAHRYGARLWFARIMLTWGIATLLLAFTSSAAIFYVLRFLLGAAEAGLYPALLFYITLWFPRADHARAMGFLTIGSALGNATGALISGPLLDMNGVMGFQGWQWIFLVTGALPVAGVAVVLWLIRDNPSQARFLTEPEKARLIDMIEPTETKPHGWREILQAISAPRVLGHGAAYTVILTALFGVIYWTPSLIKSFGATGAQNGMLVALPWLIDVVLLLVIPRRLHSRKAILSTLIGLTVLGAAAFAAAVMVDNSFFRYGCLLVGIPCISVSLALYWTFPARLFRGAQAAAAIAAISTLGNMGGLIGQNLMPAVAKAGGGPSAALWAPCVCLSLMAVGAVIALSRGRSQAAT